MPAKRVQGGRIFVTHASSDQPLAEALARYILSTSQLDESQVFCSSAEGMGIPVGDQLINHLESVLRNTSVVVQLVTPAYLRSEYCMWELGATWIRRSIQKFPMHVPEINPADIREGPLAHRIMSPIDEVGLSELHRRICEKLKLTIRKPAKRTVERFIARVPGLVAESQIRYRDLTWHKVERKARIAEASHHIHKAFHHLRDAGYVKATIRTTDSVQFREDVRASVDAMTNAFSLVSGAKCRMCIKKLEIQRQQGGEDSVQRSFLVSDRFRSGNEPQRAARSVVDLVDLNTDFSSILNEEIDVFFSNDLVKLYREGKYRNSHWDGLPTNPSYRSTIVWPIRKIGGHPLSIPNYEPTGNELQVQYGYVCLDSKTTDAFDEQSDVQLGSAYADTLFTVLWDGASDFSPEVGP
jgi:hypothetical protein